MEEALRQLVINRAGGRCEYCHFQERASFLSFETDHIIAEKHCGPSEDWNLAWVCCFCNAFKGPNLAGWVPETDEVVRLFHPRRDTWTDHFRWNGAELVPLSAIAQASISVLQINHQEAIWQRSWLIEAGETFS